MAVETEDAGGDSPPLGPASLSGARSSAAGAFLAGAASRCSSSPPNLEHSRHSVPGPSGPSLRSALGQKSLHQLHSHAGAAVRGMI